MRLRTVAISLLGIAGVGAAFFAGYTIKEGLFAGAEEPKTNVVVPLDAIKQEAEQPRFAGELVGIYISPSTQSPPPGYRLPSEVCAGQPVSKLVPWEQAGELNLNVDLPVEYVLDAESDNTGAVACGETVTTARRDYKVKASSGMTADVIIGRGIFRREQYDVAANRVGVSSFGDRDAVLIKTITADGVGQRSGVFFPEPFGETFIYGFSLPLDDLLALGELVGETTN